MVVLVTKQGTESSAFTYARHIEDEQVIDIAITFKNILLIDARKVRQTVIQFNNIGTNDLNYQIFGMADYDPEVLEHIKDPTNAKVNKTNSNWVNLLSIIAGETGTTYTHTFSKPLSVTNRFYESFSNEWFAVLVTAQSVTDTTELSIWSRGQS